MGKHIMIKGVRCSFPQLYGTVTRKNGESFGPNITILLDKKEHAAYIAEVKAAMAQAIAENEKLKKFPPASDKLCLRVPSAEREEYPENSLILKANAKHPPVVLHSDMTRMTEQDNKIYSGCYVNVKIEVWGQANEYGKRVNAKLLAVQFAADGESFDGGYVSEELATEGFGSLSGVEGFDTVSGMDDLPF
jgi:hypothetical protein